MIELNTKVEKFTAKVAMILGTSWAFLVAAIIFASWVIIAGFNHSLKNPGTFIIEVTSLFVFVHLFIVQRNSNKDIKAIHIKLDELIATIDGANNKLIKAEQSPEHVVDELHEMYVDLANRVDHPTKPVSIDDTPKAS